jgi:histone H3/H4
MANKPAETPRLVVASAIKEAVPDEFRVAGDLADGLNAKVAGLLKDAAARAKSNGRSTIRPDDL